MQVQPNASENMVVRFEEGVWHLRIAAPPVKGKANSELIKFLSDLLGVSKGRITIEKGYTSRRKVIAVEGMGEGEVRGRMSGFLRGDPSQQSSPCFSVVLGSFILQVTFHIA